MCLSSRNRVISLIPFFSNGNMHTDVGEVFLSLNLYTIRKLFSLFHLPSEGASYIYIKKNEREREEGGGRVKEREKGRKGERVGVVKERHNCYF